MDIEINVALFERMMKNIILLEYESVLPREKKLEIKKKKIITDDDNLNEHNFQAEIVRNIFKHLIDVTCLKKVKIHDQELEIKYGEYLNNGLIEYYTFLICKKYSAEYTMDKRYTSNFEFVKELSDEFDLDTLIFDNVATEIFEKIQSKELEAKYDWIEIGEYLNSSEASSGGVDNNNVSENDSLLYLVYTNGKMHFKYYDSSVHTIEFEGEECDKAFNIYRDLAFNDKLSVSNFISKLERMGISYNIIHEEKSRKDLFDYSFSEHKEEVVSSDAHIDLYDDVKRNETEESDVNIDDEDTVSLDEVISEIEEKLSSDEYLDNENDESVTAYDVINELDNSGDIVDSTVSEDADALDNYVETAASDDADALDNYMESVVSEEKKTIEVNTQKDEERIIKPKDIISEAEYEALCMKAIKKNGLTPEEFEQMDAFDKYYYGDSDDSLKSKDKSSSSEVNSETKVIDKQESKEEFSATKEEKAEVDSDYDTSFIAELKETIRTDDDINDKDIKNEKSENIKLTSNTPKNKSSFIKKAIITILVIVFTISVGVILGVVMFKLKA